MGQKYKIYKISCGKCNTEALTYHKYGSGKGILRLYFHRIMEPSHLVNVINQDFQKVSDVPNLQCENCGEVLGVPIESKGHKWAFRMRKGIFHRKLIK